jgi:hydrogenase-4 component B
MVREMQGPGPALSTQKEVQVTAVCFNAALAAYFTGALAGVIFRRRPRAARLLSVSFALAGALLSAVSSIAALTGGKAEWTVSPGLLFSYGFCLDPLSAFFVLTLSILGIAVATYSFGYLESRKAGLIGSLLNGLLASLMVVFGASNAFFFMVGWELMALTAYGLVTFEHESEESRNAGLLYLIMSHADAGCLLLGFALLGQAAHSLDYPALRQAAAALPLDRQAWAFVLFLLGFGIKAGIIPLHIWLPAAHPVAPSNASALLSGIVIKTGIYGMARVFFEFLGDVPLWMGTVVLSIAAVSAILGVLYALMEHDLKRLLAYHSIENIGIILLGFGSAMMFRASGHANLAAFALTAGLFHTLNHAIFKCLLFLGAGRGGARRAYQKYGESRRADPADAAHGLLFPHWRDLHLRTAAHERLRQRVAHVSGPARRLRNHAHADGLALSSGGVAAGSHGRARRRVFRESLRYYVSRFAAKQPGQGCQGSPD